MTWTPDDVIELVTTIGILALFALMFIVIGRE